jgi:uncharacterized membrane protein
MFTAIWLGGPAVAGALLAFGTRVGWKRAWILFVLGVVLALGLVIVVYLRAPIDYAHDRSGCSDCGEYLGRWWEPDLVVFVVLVGYVFWSLGVLVGLALTTSFALARSRRPDAG